MHDACGAGQGEWVSYEKGKIIFETWSGVQRSPSFQEAGVPDGCVNVIHGAHDSVNFICDHPDIKAISFVGSDIAVSPESFTDCFV